MREHNIYFDEKMKNHPLYQEPEPELQIRGGIKGCIVVLRPR